ncbi:vesicle transport protein GOT1-like [Nymphaea colorata]|nr:vesicle transport protein GOT1-like [Nymphaea colorata]XP_031481732.1 vesicle transport protein GOT1-like [Nymphaea colorata]XP_031481733.1 vesicle transport protein GOT1-like [Nymphaea colorata]XP_031481734.1 vesicle transport protein GOT1-like [Nymphaea colorata]XP_049933094.1 vesicle transport protein GOT1-like [Nymphaea colorata]
MAYELDEQKRIGVGLIGFGLAFTFLGIILFLDRGLLALGNILCLSGVALILGWRSTCKLFSEKVNIKGSLSFFVGVFLILVGWPILGILLEFYGSVVLFRGFWPSIKVFLCNIPVLGWFIQYPSLFLNRFWQSKAA